MIVSNIRLEIDDKYKLLKATVIWENCDRPQHELIFRFLKDQKTIDPNVCADPFLTACAPIAYRHGEHRLRVEGNLCPLLVENIYTVLEYLRNWYWYEYNLEQSEPLKFKIEAAGIHENKLGIGESASFFSGGADSLDLLINNHKLFSNNHALKIKSAIYIHGFDFGNRPKRGDEEDFFTSTRSRFSNILQEFNVNLVPVWSNIRSMDKDTHGWQYETSASALAAVGQCLSNYIGNIWLASSAAIPQLTPWSSHPLLDRCYSSSAVNIRHFRERISRIEKIKNVAGIPSALNVLRVCFFGNNDELNCGHCEKCIRTKLALLICKKLDDAQSMPDNKLTFIDIIKTPPLAEHPAIYAREFLSPLMEIGRKDLALALRIKLLARMITMPMKYKDIIKYTDKMVFGGRIKRIISRYK